MNINDTFQHKSLDELLEEARDLYNKSENENAEKIAKYVLRKATDDNEVLKQAQAYITIGTTYFNRSIYETALENYLLAENILNTIGDEKELLPCKVNIAIVQNAIGNFDEALIAYNQASEILGDDDNTIQHAQLYNSIGNVYSKKKEPNNALVYFEKVTAISLKLKSNYGIAMGYRNEAACLVELGNFYEAAEKASAAVEIAKSNAFEGLRIDALQTYAEAEIGIENFDEAYKLLESELCALQQLNNDYALREHYRLLYVASKKTNQYQLALKWHEAFFSINEKMLSIERHKVVSQMQMQYETEKKERTIKQLEISVKESEIKQLKSQMNPHFIFNTLSSIESLLLNNNIDNAVEALQSFSHLMRDMLFRSQGAFISLSNEVAYLEKYIQLESLQMKGDFSYNIKFSNELKGFEIPAMVLQPIVENALKHGLFHKQGSKYLEINFQFINESSFEVSIIDNGIGRNAAAAINAKKKNNNGFATQAIETRLKLIQEIMPVNISYNVTDLYNKANISEGTQINFKFKYTD